MIVQKGVFCLCLNLIFLMYLSVSVGAVKDNGVYVLPMKGDINTLQAFYIQAALGTPLQTLNLLVDTGSTDLIVPSSNCTSCGSIRHYNSYSSSSSKSSYSCSAFSVPCSFCYVDSCGVGDVYGGGESTAVGFVASDLLTLSPTIPPVNVILAQILFESVTEGSGPFIPPPIDGIIGMSFPSNSLTRSPTFFDVLYSQNAVHSNVFAHCLSNNRGGKLILGGVVDKYYTGSVAWTPIIQPSWYVVNVTDMRVSGVSVGVSHKVYNRDDAIVDSGTAQFIIPQDAYFGLKSLMFKNCSRNYLHGGCDVPSTQTIFDNMCYNFTQEQVNMYPEIELVMTAHKSMVPSRDEAVVSLGAQYYLMPPSGSKTRENLCMGIIYMSGYEGTAVGDVLLQGFLTIYDRDNMRLGFATVSNTCFE